jgi:mannose-6-phosphate isomerase-like protein (cupin superfamily)
MPASRTALAVLALALAFGAGALATAGGQGTPVRTALAAKADPVGAKGRTLGLSRVTVPPGASLALHRHTGTQIAYIARGTLSYTVKRGAVTVRTGAADANPTLVRRITAGQTARIRAGQWLVEQPSVTHRAANRGTTGIVIYLATLLPNGDPPSVPAR